MASAGSDHSPLHMEMNVRPDTTKKYFKFLNCWTQNATFLPLVQQIWESPVLGNAMRVFHLKIKALCSAMSKWSRQEYGDIFKQTKEYEGKMKRAEEAWIQSNKEEDRAALNEINAQYIKHLKVEESVLKQTTQLQWFKDGDANTREDLISCIPTMVTPEDNELLATQPTLEELKQVVFSMYPTSAAGPDGLNGKVFHHCWEIIKDDLFKEIVQGIKKPNIGANEVIKIDMTKAYDRVSWDFTCIMMRRLGFSEFIIDMTLDDYESTSGQLINKSKSHFMIAPCAFHYTIRRIQQITGFSRKESLLTYLGCPLYTGRTRIIHFNCLISKVMSRIRGWHGRLLSYGGRLTLIKYVLQSLPIHLLSAVSPPKTILKQIEKLTANFFWGMDKERNRYHWASLQKMSITQEEGGIGLRAIEDVCKSMEFKQWWTFRTKQSLWSSFLLAKYCQRSHPVSKKWNSGQSQTWMKMILNRKEAEHHIQWRLHSGNASFWWDNWLGTGNLASYREGSGRPGNIKVSYFWNAGQWDI
ncbi:PREDICTED: uncharacterized protein LOC109207745 [Nicotiana attenuata]|uniref:uncharacterized protein LOC109207745 n=1 Tax=Nicotiana attenuata TaxID=49451 RepID=UPI000904C0DD|nr:PREDICTED: uncharacterized protein LOC109207745 [Nicotiana attenuata]